MQKNLAQQSLIISTTLTALFTLILPMKLEASHAGLQDIELAMVSQGVSGRLHNLPAASQASCQVRLGSRILVFVGHGLSFVRPGMECAFSSDQVGARQWHGKN